MEDDGELLAQRQAGNAQGDRGGGLRVQEGPPKDVVGVLVAVHTVPRYRHIYRLD